MQLTKQQLIVKQQHLMLDQSLKGKLTAGDFYREMSKLSKQIRAAK